MHLKLIFFLSLKIVIPNKFSTLNMYLLLNLSLKYTLKEGRTINIIYVFHEV